MKAALGKENSQYHMTAATKIKDACKFFGQILLFAFLIFKTKTLCKL